MGNEEKIQEQVAVIEGVIRETGLSYDELAEIVRVKPETMRKLRKGYQATSEPLLNLIRSVPHLPSVLARNGNGATKGKVERKTSSKRAESVAPDKAETLTERFAYVISNGTAAEQQILSGAIEAAYRAISKRMKGEAPAAPVLAPVVVASGYRGGSGERRPRKIIDVPFGHELRPVLGDIAAGHPQEAIAQADQMMLVPPNIAAKCTYILRVRGDSMIDRDINDGDLVVMSHLREPRNNDVVAARVDGETTLKTLVKKGDDVHLRSENKNFPPQITPKGELTIQGVMLHNLGPE